MTHVKNRRVISACVAMFLMLGSWFGSFWRTPALAQSSGQATASVLSPQEAAAQAATGSRVLVDVRTPEEWRETGIPAPARAITMHQSRARFIAELDAALGGDRTRPLAIICRTGNRTGRLAPELRALGFSNVADVAEGTVGGANGPGWIKAGLPLRAP
jgi:rhodanese-related sulfurtransferase